MSKVNLNEIAKNVLAISNQLVFLTCPECRYVPTVNSNAYIYLCQHQVDALVKWTETESAGLAVSHS